MAYRRYRRRYSGIPAHVIKSQQDYDRLQRLFGDAIADVKKAFFNLDPKTLDRLFTVYGQAHGSSAENYARETFSSWRSGQRGLAGQTMERLIELVPPFLGADARQKLLVKVLDHNRPSRPVRTVNINVKQPEAGLAALNEAVAAVESTDVLAHLPSTVMDAARWLYDDDATVIRAVLAQSTRHEADRMRAQAAREVALLERTIRAGQIQSATYSVEFPTETIRVHAATPSKCFVVTVALGSDAPETWVLRRFRDRVLNRSEFGRALVRTYYRHGPGLAAWVSERPVARAVAVVLSRSAARVTKAVWRLD